MFCYISLQLVLLVVCILYAVMSLLVAADLITLLIDVLQCMLHCAAGRIVQCGTNIISTMQQPLLYCDCTSMAHFFEFGWLANASMIFYFAARIIILHNMCELQV